MKTRDDAWDEYMSFDPEVPQSGPVAVAEKTGFYAGFTAGAQWLAEAIKREYVTTNWPDEDTFCNRLVPEVLATLLAES